MCQMICVCQVICVSDDMCAPDDLYVSAYVYVSDHLFVSDYLYVSDDLRLSDDLCVSGDELSDVCVYYCVDLKKKVHTSVGVYNKQCTPSQSIAFYTRTLIPPLCFWS